jgi:murein tripeptide amidase MpaA
LLLSITILPAILSPAGAAGRPLALNITNAGESSYPSAWAGYRAVATYDMQHWFRVQDTTYDDAAGVLTIKHTPEHDCVRYAYFAHYSLERHAQLIMQMQVSTCMP